MKKSTGMILALAMLAPLSAFGGQEGYYSYSFARLSYVRGDVHIQRADDLGYQEGLVNLPIVEGDRLGINEGQAEIHFGRRNHLRVDRHTQLEFVTLPREYEDRVKLHLLEGSIFLRLHFIGEEKSFEVHTPDSSFYMLEEGLYRVDVGRNGRTEFYVFEGSAEAAGESGSFFVRRREKILAANGYFPSSPSYFHSVSDDFSRWNESREALSVRRASRTYLPSELYEYETELADNGQWVYERPYGYVWVPYVRHYHDWRPYFYGRWAWYPVIGWTWVSYEPWGWSVYRYGRWHWRGGLGWYWIPTRVWGPAWVHWYGGYNYIAWSPLTYYNAPGVIINNVFYDRYYNPYYPIQSRALVVVHKNQLQAPDISRAALSQTTLSSIGRVSLRAQQPDIKPQLNRSVGSESTVGKAFSRESLRRVGPGYSPGKTSLSSQGLRSTAGENSSRLGASTRPEGRESATGSSLRSPSRERTTGVASGEKAAYPSRWPRVTEVRPSSTQKSRTSLSDSNTNPVYPSRRGQTSFSTPSREGSSSGQNQVRESARRSLSSRQESIPEFSQRKATDMGRRNLPGFAPRFPSKSPQDGINRSQHSSSRGYESSNTALSRETSRFSLPRKDNSSASHAPLSRILSPDRNASRGAGLGISSSSGSRSIIPRFGTPQSRPSVSPSRSLSRQTTGDSSSSRSSRSTPSRTSSGRVHKKDG